MVANRRVRWNFSLDRALEWARDLKKPLLILEALRADYQWASDRMHHFIIQGMIDNARALQKQKGVRYYPYVEPALGHGKGLVDELVKRASVVISDDFPCFFLPRMLQAVAKRCPVRMEVVDSNGLLPMRAAERVFPRAYSFRRFLQQQLLPHLHETPASDPFDGLKLPKGPTIGKQITDRWPANIKLSTKPEKIYEDLPIDHDVTPGIFTGGAEAAAKQLGAFIDSKLEDYAELRNQPQQDVSSGLSPYLHFGHISSHEIFDALVRKEGWSENDVAEKPTGSSEGWWGMSEPAEGFVDQLATWRELGYNYCWQRDDYDQYESLPPWARETLEEHESDTRPHLYDQQQLELSQTHDELWNAAQRQLVREGHIHNYLRMLWGKKILQWTKSPRVALEIMIHLNNKYAVDGRNPNSYSGICWVLGRYDRAWGPEREIFGKIRYMTSENTARKVRVKDYIKKYAALT